MRDRPNDTHRAVASAKAGRPLKPSEVVDHVNTDKSDNSPANLRVMSRSEHSKRHTAAALRHTAKLQKALTMEKRREKLY